MADAETLKKTTNGSHPPLTHDAAVVVGAGVASLHQLHLPRFQSLKAFSAALAAGETCYWNCNPSARFDPKSYIYEYLSSGDLYSGSIWSEKFPAQPDIERWMHYAEGFETLDLKMARAALLCGVCKPLSPSGPEAAPAPCTDLPP